MIAKQLISDIISPLTLNDSAAIALSWMDDLKVMHMPVVNEQEYIGLLSEHQIFELSDFDAAFSDLKLQFEQVYVFEQQHILDAIRIFSEHKVSVLPVLDDKRNYVGCITYSRIMDSFAKITSVNNPGGIIVLEMSSKDYSVSQIAQIVESNDARILSLFITSHTDSTKIEVSLKINKIEIGPILQTFSRYDYTIKASYSDEESSDDLKNRYDSFMKYLNI
jgi:acetoin utilization protein AcuB